MANNPEIVSPVYSILLRAAADPEAAGRSALMVIICWIWALLEHWAAKRERRPRVFTLL